MATGIGYIGSNVTFHCRVCNGSKFQRIFRKGDKDFVSCNNCKLISIYPMPTFEQIKSYYDSEYRVETGMGRVLRVEQEIARITARERLKTVLHYKNRGCLLDIGCSTGIFLEEAKKVGFECEGIDISEIAIEEATRKGLKAYSAAVEDFYSDKQYDVVTSFDVIEHTLNPLHFSQSMRTLVKKGGIIIITTPNSKCLLRRIMGKRWYFFIPEQHFFIFDERNLGFLLENHGFKVLEVSKAKKALHYNYCLFQFKAYNPFIYEFLNGFGSIIPDALKRRPFRIYIGEMMIVAKHL